MAYKPFKMKGHTLPGIKQRQSPAKQKADTTKTYPKSYTKKDIEFLKEQREDVVRYEDLDEKGKAIWKKQGKPVPKQEESKMKKVFDSGPGCGEAFTKKSPGKWVQFIPMALSAMSSMKKNKEEQGKILNQVINKK